MFSLSPSMQYYLYGPSADLRKGFDGLCGLVIGAMKKNPSDGSAYIFINKNRDKMKILVWQTGGFLMYYKRLERGTFERIEGSLNNCSRTISWQDLVLLVGGISLNRIHLRKRYMSCRQERRNTV